MGITMLIYTYVIFWQSGCLNEAQTWKSMTMLNKDLPLEEAWGPEVWKALPYKLFVSNN